YDMEKRYFHKDGLIVWILLSVSLVRDDAGQPMYFVGQIQDITARKHAESQLVDSEFRYRTIANPVPGFVFEGVVRDGHPQPTGGGGGLGGWMAGIFIAFLNLAARLSSTKGRRSVFLRVLSPL